jgi:hypothetical protein
MIAGDSGKCHPAVSRLGEQVADLCALVLAWHGIGTKYLFVEGGTVIYTLYISWF